MSEGNAAKTNTRIRKVFLKDGIFVCGLCNTNYTDKAAAEACLARCTPSHLNDEIVQETAATKRYRCKFCKRIYEEIESAKNCSKACRISIEKRMGEEKVASSASSREAKMQALLKFANSAQAQEALKQVQQELKANGNVFRPKKTVGMLPFEGVKFVRDKHMFRCIRCKQRYNASAEAISCYEMHGDGHKPRQEVKQRDDGHKYFRDAAKYGCQKCRSHYFSADEAAQCFDSHPADYVRPRPGADDLEIPDVTVDGSPSPAQERELSDKDMFYRDGAKYVCRNCDKKYFTRDEVVTCFKGHPQEAAEAAAPEAAQAVPDAEMFHRDGAKYVCKNCRAKYFTRAEVIQCFESHS